MYRLAFLIILIVAIASLVWGQTARPIMICQNDFQSISMIRVCNFGSNAVQSVPPDTWQPDGPVVCQDIPMPDVRIPPPPGVLCPNTSETTTYLVVENQLSPPGKPNRIAAWAYSKWQVRSGMSNVITPPVERMAPPRML